MCLILFSIDSAGHVLTVAANRDEFYNRPTAHAVFWADHSNVLGGRDLAEGGTWMGFNRNGRFAAVTNFREPAPDPLPPNSRGALTRDFLTGDMSPEAYLAQVDRDADLYRGFNLLLGDAGGYYYFSNRAREILKLTPGAYGLSNQLLDCDWPKVVDGTRTLASLVSEGAAAESLFAWLRDADGTGQPFSAPFIDSAEYGTCASTVLTVSKAGKVYFEERSFGPGGVPGTSVIYDFEVSP